MIADGESIITYKGYTDIEYGDNTIIVTDSSKIAYTVSFDSNNRIPFGTRTPLSFDLFFIRDTMKSKSLFISSRLIISLAMQLKILYVRS